jgi:hypothetical protein
MWNNTLGKTENMRNLCDPIQICETFNYEVQEAIKAQMQQTLIGGFILGVVASCIAGYVLWKLHQHYSRTP